MSATPEAASFLSVLTGSFARPAAENPTAVMMKAAYGALGLNARHINGEVSLPTWLT